MFLCFMILSLTSLLVYLGLPEDSQDYEGQNHGGVAAGNRYTSSRINDRTAVVHALARLSFIGSVRQNAALWGEGGYGLIDWITRACHHPPALLLSFD